MPDLYALSQDQCRQIISALAQIQAALSQLPTVNVVPDAEEKKGPQGIVPAPSDDSAVPV